MSSASPSRFKRSFGLDVDGTARSREPDGRAECRFACLRPGRAGAEWSASDTAGRGMGPASRRQAERSGRWYRRGLFDCDVIVMPMKFHGFRDRFVACPAAGRLAGVAGLEFPDHSPDAASFSAFDDSQRSRTVERGVGPLQPLADSLGLHHVRQRVKETRQLGQTLLRRTSRRAAALPSPLIQNTGRQSSNRATVRRPEIGS